MCQIHKKILAPTFYIISVKCSMEILFTINIALHTLKIDTLNCIDLLAIYWLAES